MRRSGMDGWIDDADVTAVAVLGVFVAAGIVECVLSVQGMGRFPYDTDPLCVVPTTTLSNGRMRDSVIQQPGVCCC